MQRQIKRALDMAISCCGLVICFPACIVIAILIKMKLGSPVLFRQDRVGLNGQVFEMIKFRTMKDSVDENGILLPDHERLTRFGKFLRQTSLDELPELINVLKGDMSLVGPRPLLVEYLSLYSEQQMERHRIRPGITGYAQVNGRNAITWSKRFEFDLFYIENVSLWLDFKILFKTFIKVSMQSDINQQGHVTMEKFNGMN